MVFIHGMRNSPEYRSWRSMKRRCYNKNTCNYSWYGGNGITVCESWLSFANFYKDMGPRPEGTTLHRLENKSVYCKENCKWAGIVEQNRLRKSVKLSESIAQSIRLLYAAGGTSHRKLAKQFNTSSAMIGFIINQINWKVQNGGTSASYETGAN